MLNKLKKIKTNSLVLENQNNFSFLNLPEISKKRLLQKKSLNYCLNNLDPVFEKKSNVSNCRFLFLNKKYNSKLSFIEFKRGNQIRIKKNLKNLFSLLVYNLNNKKISETHLFQQIKGGFLTSYFGFPSFIPKSRARKFLLKKRPWKNFLINFKIDKMKRRFSQKRIHRISPVSSLTR
jgi:hypothetical protein